MNAYTRLKTKMLEIMQESTPAPPTGAACVHLLRAHAGLLLDAQAHPGHVPLRHQGQRGDGQLRARQQLCPEGGAGP